MNKSFFALALALSVLPVAALAQDSNAAAPGPPTDAQRQQMHQTMMQFAQQEEQLHQQMRTQILSSLSPVQRRAVAAEIGNLVISPNPDPAATAQRIDAVLSPGARQRILAAHTAFATQSRALHEQMKTQMQQMMPDRQMPDHPMPSAQMRAQMNDAGWILLHALPPEGAGMMGMMGHMWDHGQGAPPH